MKLVYTRGRATLCSLTALEAAEVRIAREKGGNGEEKADERQHERDDGYDDHREDILARLFRRDIDGVYFFLERLELCFGFRIHTQIIPRPRASARSCGDTRGTRAT